MDTGAERGTKLEDGRVQLIHTWIFSSDGAVPDTKQR